jgi:hypothetical protein
MFALDKIHEHLKGSVQEDFISIAPPFTQCGYL